MQIRIAKSEANTQIDERFAQNELSMNWLNVDFCAPFLNDNIVLSYFSIVVWPLFFSFKIGFLKHFRINTVSSLHIVCAYFMVSLTQSRYEQRRMTRTQKNKKNANSKGRTHLKRNEGKKTKNRMYNRPPSEEKKNAFQVNEKFVVR